MLMPIKVKFILGVGLEINFIGWKSLTEMLLAQKK
jgi:hypothetical protein